MTGAICKSSHCRTLSCRRVVEGWVPVDRVPAADAKRSQVCVFPLAVERTTECLNTSMLQEAMDETFLLSNIAPQVGAGFNRHCKS